MRADFVALFSVAILALNSLDSSADDLPPVTGLNVPELASFDDMMLRLMEAHDLPGASLAVARGGKLLYARGFGYADVDAKDPVAPDSRFRIASISKPLTAVAVMQLAERGKLSLDDKIFDLLELPPTEKSDARLNEITVRHCLQHTGGWDRDKSFDAMFRSVEMAKSLGVAPPAGSNNVIKYMLDVPLDFAPGERYAYSNFGYCLLGRAIEKRTGDTYENFVKKSVLAPLGVTDMQIGRTLADGRADREVKYYHQGTGPAVMGPEIGASVPHPYGAWHLEAMDSHGGWIATAGDLVRFACAFDDPAACPLLNSTSIETMFSRPQGLAGHDGGGSPKESFYSCGWFTRQHSDGRRDAWHSGSLPGTSTMLVRRHDGVVWAVLFNRRDGKDAQRMSKHVDEQIHAAVNSVAVWPAKDLFPRAK